jgi:urease accessory protein
MEIAGEGELEFERAGGRTVLRRAYARSPLRFLTPRNHGSSAWVYASSMGGGLVGGDALRVRAEVRAGATGVLLSQSATKVYRSERGARQSLEARVGDGALLVSAPDPVLCFAGASLDQRLEFELAAGGSLVAAETLVSGRQASGERWLFDGLRSELLVRREGRAIFHERLRFDSREGELAGRSGRFNALGLAVLAGPAVADAAREWLEPRTAPGRCLRAAGETAGGAVWLRLAAESAEELARELRGHLVFLTGLLGDDPFSRKW